jgi:hypothetical protein
MLSKNNMKVHPNYREFFDRPVKYSMKEAISTVLAPINGASLSTTKP